MSGMNANKVKIYILSYLFTIIIPDEGYSSNVPDEGYSSNLPDEGYSRNTLCALNWISMLLFLYVKERKRVLN